MIIGPLLDDPSLSGLYCEIRSSRYVTFEKGVTIVKFLIGLMNLQVDNPYTK